MKLKQIIITLTLFIFVTLLIPTLLVLPFQEDPISSKLTEQITDLQQNQTNLNTDQAVMVAVYRSEQQEIEQLPLEQYVAGVVASEMPATFAEEALKAQALAARTFIVNQLLAEEVVGLPDGATVTDTELHQVYKNESDLKEIWGQDFAKNYRKIINATAATAGEILTYNGKPISAQYFSTSNGYTENSEAYWSSPFDYLTSVSSPWDKDSPKFYDKKVIPIRQFEQLLNVAINDSNELGKIIERTPGKRVGKITIAGKTFTGREIREKLQLQSADFQMTRKNDHIIVETKGYGHGVGMSQYGANGMALAGKQYDEIVKYYYRGVEISQLDNHLGKLTASR